MKKMLAAAALIAATIALGGWFSPQTGLKASGGGSSGPAYGMIYGGTEGDNPLIYASSTLPFIHRVQLRYRYVPGAYATHLGKSTITLTAVSHSYGDSALSVVKEVTLYDLGLYDGDSLYVNIRVAAADSTVLSTHEIGYLIDHDIVTLAMGNPYGGTLFNPSGLTPSTTITCNDSTKFRHGYIRRDGAYADSCFNRTTTTVTLQTTLPLWTPGAAHQYGMLWWDLSNIPDNVTIVEAKLCIDLAYSNNLTIAEGEGLIAVLDTLSSDMGWVGASKAVCSQWMPFYNNTGWTHMNRVTDTEWSPPIASRNAAWFWGLSSSPARDITGDAGTMATNDDVLIDVKEILQYWVDYHDSRQISNAGFWLTGLNDAAQTVVITTSTAGSQENRMPSLIVRYQTKAYTDYDWNGYPFVFVFTSDDAHGSNFGYMDEFNARDKKYTIFSVLDRLDISNHMTSAQLLAAYNDGFEIGNHGLRHNRTRVVAEDSLGYLVGRSWLSTKLGLSGADTANIKSYAYAFGDTVNKTTAGASLTIPILESFGYGGARIAGNISTTSGAPLLWDAVSHLYTVDKWNWNYLADNDDDNTSLVAAADSVRHHLRRVYGQSAYRGGPDGGEPIITLSHGTSGTSYAEMDSTVLGVLLDEIIRRGDTWITTYGEMMDYYRTNHKTGANGLKWEPK